MTSTEEGSGGSTERSADEPVLPAAATAVVRRRRVQTRQRRLTIWLVVSSLLFVAVLVALAWFGYDASLRVGGGTEAKITDPDAPGYVAEPRPTPTDLYAVVDDDDALASVLVVVPDPEGTGGTAVPLPSSFSVPPGSDGEAPVTLGTVYSEGGIDALSERLGVALGFRFFSAETVPPATLAALVGDEPISVEIFDNLVALDPERPADTSADELRYPAGTVELAPEELTEFLGFEGRGDPPPNQALRARTLWEEVLDSAAGRDLGDLPSGERSEGSDGPGFGPAVQSLVDGDVTFDSVPVTEVPVPGTVFTAWMPDEGNLDGFVARVVPLPESPAPGVRPPVAVLDGTGGTASLPAVVPLVVRSGGEVAAVGNADSFDVAVSTVEYAGGSTVRSVAEGIAGELGIDATEADGTIEGAAIRVVIGADRAS